MYHSLLKYLKKLRNILENIELFFVDAEVLATPACISSHVKSAWRQLSLDFLGCFQILEDTSILSAICNLAFSWKNCFGNSSYTD